MWVILLTLSERIFKFASMSITLGPILWTVDLRIGQGFRGRRRSDGMEPGAIDAT